MNIDLKYKNKSYNFQLRKDISIKYIEDLASKLISKDKSSFGLSYNNNILSEYSNYLLKDIIQTDKIIPIVISPKIDKNMAKIERLLPKISLYKCYDKNSKDYNCNNNRFITNENERCLSLNNKFNKDILKYLIREDVKKKKEKKYHIKNEVFEEIYDNKENELLMLMNKLSQKIKEYDDILYTKYRSGNKNIKNNRELLVFEKNIIDFKNWQLQYIKKLINYLEERNDLKEFYLELKNYCIKDRFRKNKKVEQGKLNSITQENEIESRNKDDIFPLLIKDSDNKPYLTINEKDKIIRNENVNEKEQIDEKSILINEEQINTNIFKRNMNDKINFQEMKKNKTIDEEKYFRFKNKCKVKNKVIPKTKKSQNIKSVLEKQKYITNINTNKLLENENDNNIVKNRIDNNNINNKSINNRNNIKIEGSDINNDNKYHKNYLLNNHIKNGRSDLSIESVNYDMKKLYSILDIHEPNHIENESNISSIVDRSLENESGNSEEKDLLDLGNKEEKKINKRYIQNYRLRKLNKKNKKLGMNEFDFLI